MTENRVPNADPPHVRRQEPFAGQLRVRVGALLFDDPEDPTGILLVEHEGLWSERTFWTPPGGGVQFGETLEEALVREVKEETALEVKAGPLRYTLDFVRPPLHAVSFYFQATQTDRTALSFTVGCDPELRGSDQLIRDVRMVPFDEVAQYHTYPERLIPRLLVDAPAGFPSGVQYLGPLY